MLEFRADLDRSLVEAIDVLRGNADAKLVRSTAVVWPVRGLEMLIG